MSSTANHYEAHSADTYEDAYFYEPGAYMQYLVDLVTKKMGLDSKTDQPRHLVDIGGGTGNFARALTENISHMMCVTVIEPFLEESTDENLKDDKVFFVKAPAEIFLSLPDDKWRHKPFHQILIKETIHHIDETVRVQILRSIYNELELLPAQSTAPSILIITRPQVEIDYPFWEAAREVWRENQPSLQQLTSELEDAGFVNVSCTIEKYDSSISLERWKGMVMQRFWSTFSDFTTDELKKGCEELERERPPDEDGNIFFEDRLLFITGDKVR